MRLHRTLGRELPDLWPLIRDRIASCCARSGGKYEPVDLLLNFLSGRMDLWLVLDDLDQSASHEPPHQPSRSAVRAASAALGDSRQIVALVITEIVAYPRITVCKLLACTGKDAQSWLDLLAPIEAWAKSRGCGVMEPICRPGWERRLKPLGYRKTHVVLEKSL